MRPRPGFYLRWWKCATCNIKETGHCPTLLILFRRKKNKTKKQPLFVLPGEVKRDSSNPWRTRAANLNLHSDFDVPHKPAGWFSKRTPWYHIRQWTDGRPGQHALGDLWEVKQADKTKKYFFCVCQHNPVSQWSSCSNCEGPIDTVHAWASKFGKCFEDLYSRLEFNFQSWRERSCFNS